MENTDEAIALHLNLRLLTPHRGWGTWLVNTWVLAKQRVNLVSQSPPNGMKFRVIVFYIVLCHHSGSAILTQYTIIILHQYFFHNLCITSSSSQHRVEPCISDRIPILVPGSIQHLEIYHLVQIEIFFLSANYVSWFYFLFFFSWNQKRTFPYQPILVISLVVVPKVCPVPFHPCLVSFNFEYFCLFLYFWSFFCCIFYLIA